MVPDANVTGRPCQQVVPGQGRQRQRDREVTLVKRARRVRVRQIADREPSFVGKVPESREPTPVKGSRDQDRF